MSNIYKICLTLNMSFLTKNEADEYFASGRVIFAKVADLPDYKGTKNDYNACMNSDIKQTEGIFESENFLIRMINGFFKYYGFIDHKFVSKDTKGAEKRKNYAINNLDFLQGNKVDKCLIIFISIYENEIIGCYKDATMYKEKQNINNCFYKLKIHESNNVVYNIETKYAILFKKSQRIPIAVDKLNQILADRATHIISLNDNNTDREYAEKLLMRLIGKDR